MRHAHPILVASFSVLLLLLTWESRHSRLEKEAWMISMEGEDSAPRKVVLHSDTDLTLFADSLFGAGVIRHPDVLRWPARILGWKRLKAGHYLIRHDETVREALDRLGKGDQDPVDVVIHPGATLGELAVRLSTMLKADSSSFADCLNALHQACRRSNIDPNHLIGRMLPDTYSVFWTASPAQVVSKILAQFDERTAALPDSPEGFEHLGLDMDDILTLASIVEWETSMDEERARISRLYLNRLARSMRLQADPTVVFAIGEKRRLFYRDYLVEHPYNTYQITGLPPGPVTNPSMASIQAVLQPEVHDYLYMVATPDGYHEFNVSYADHQAAAKRWQDWIREQVRLRRQGELGDL